MVASHLATSRIRTQTTDARSKTINPITIVLHTRCSPNTDQPNGHLLSSSTSVAVLSGETNKQLSDCCVISATSIWPNTNCANATASNDSI